MRSAAKGARIAKKEGFFYERHSLIVRVLHWSVAIALGVLLLSGLKIFGYYPSLYWGKSSYAGRAPLLVITSQRRSDGALEGVTKIGAHVYDTTGVLGVSPTLHSRAQRRAFPNWLTTPTNLPESRHVHFFFAWLFVLSGGVYVLHAVFAGRLRRELLPTRSDWRDFWPSVLDHLRVRRPRGEAALRYNVLQKLSYLGVMFGLLPGIALMGLAMSPWLDALIPGWVDWVGGRQSARTLHFVGAWLVVLFVLVHVFEVIVTGPVNNLRSMITGKYRVEPDRESQPLVSDVNDESAG